MPHDREDERLRLHGLREPLSGGEIVVADISRTVSTEAPSQFNPSEANGKRLLDYVLSLGAGSGPTSRVRRPSRASDRSWRRPLPVPRTRGSDLRGRGETAYSVNRVRQCCTRRADVSEPAVPGGPGTPKGRSGARLAHC